MKLLMLGTTGRGTKELLLEAKRRGIYTIVTDNLSVEKAPLKLLNCTPFVRQYGILFRKWGVFVCQRDNESTTELKR